MLEQVKILVEEWLKEEDGVEEEWMEWCGGVWEVLEEGKRKGVMEWVFGRKGIKETLTSRPITNSSSSSTCMSDFLTSLMDGPYLRLNSKRHSIKREIKNRYNLKSPKMSSRLNELNCANKILENEIIEERRRREEIQGMYLLKSSKLRDSLELVKKVKSEREIVRKGCESIVKINKKLKRTIKNIQQERSKEKEDIAQKEKEWDTTKNIWSKSRLELENAVKDSHSKLTSLESQRSEEKTYLRVLESRLGEIKFDQGSRGDKKVIKELRGKVEELEKKGEEERKVKEEVEGENERLSASIEALEISHETAMSSADHIHNSEVNVLKATLKNLEDEISELRNTLENERKTYQEEKEIREDELERVSKALKDLPPPDPPPMNEEEEMSLEDTIVSLGKSSMVRSSIMSDSEVLETVEGDFERFKEKMRRREEEERDYDECEGRLREEGGGEEGEEEEEEE
ncbi:hypothetical protein TrST_g5601, partial [Triparma strigata]